MRPDEDREEGLLEKAVRPKGGRPGGRWRGLGRWTGSLTQRVRAARGLPQAVFKITSWNHNGGALWDRANYVSREGENEVETESGERLQSLIELEQLVSAWAKDPAERKDRRLSMSGVVSFPRGADEEKATEAARQFFQAGFGANHDYFFAVHKDSKQFHVHVVVKAKGHDGTQLRIGRADLADLRQLLAEKSREQGLELDASPRWARGLAPRSSAPAIKGMERRGATPRWGKEARAALDEARAESPSRAAVSRNHYERFEYARAAGIMVRGMEQLTSDTDRAKAVVAAADLALYAEQMPGVGQEPSAKVRAVTRLTEQALRASIHTISDSALKRQAIAARARLSAALEPTPERQLDRPGR